MKKIPVKVHVCLRASRDSTVREPDEDTVGVSLCRVGVRGRRGPNEAVPERRSFRGGTGGTCRTWVLPLVPLVS